MYKANLAYLEKLLGRLNVIPDDEASQYSLYDCDNEELVKSVFERHIRPYFQCAPRESQDNCKMSLKYFLTKGDAPFHQIINNQYESPMNSPTDPRAFFVWLWEVLFPGEDYHLSEQDLQSFSMIHDRNLATMKPPAPAGTGQGLRFDDL